MAPPHQCPAQWLCVAQELMGRCSLPLSPLTSTQRGCRPMPPLFPRSLSLAVSRAVCQVAGYSEPLSGIALGRYTGQLLLAATVGCRHFPCCAISRSRRMVLPLSGFSVVSVVVASTLPPPGANSSEHPNFSLEFLPFDGVSYEFFHSSFYHLMGFPTKPC